MSVNFWAGWLGVLAGFLVGAGLGLRFHNDDWLGGYASYPRRMLRLGHIALIALGFLNVVYSLGGPFASLPARAASVPWLIGLATMPAVCFLSAWRKPLRHLFFIPVGSLVLAVVLTLLGGGQP